MLQGGLFLKRDRRNIAEVLAILLLLALTVVFYRKISLSGSILTGFDTFTYFYPQESYLADSLRQGHLPLWNPYLFTGVPFLANMQTAVFYPFNLIFLVLPVPQAYAYSIVLHVFLAGTFSYLLFRRSLGLGIMAALAGAVAFMFSGFFNSLVGHINQLQAATWIPLLFLFCDLAFRRRSYRAAAAASVVLALQFTAGHAQEFYLTVFALGLFLVIRLIAETFGSKSEVDENEEPTKQSAPTNSTANPLATIVLFGLVVVLGLGLAAAQLLPSLELSSLSIRSTGLTYKEAVSFSLPPWLALKTFLPVFNDSQPYSEWLGYVGVCGLILAILGIASMPRRVFFWFALVLSLVALFFAFGQYNPLYPFAYKLIPGLKLFRVPARWIYLYTFGISILTAYGVNYLGERARRHSRAVFVRFLTITLAIGLTFLFFYLSTRGYLPFEFPANGTRAIWLVIAIATIGIIALSLIKKINIGWIAVTIVVIELFAAGEGLELNQTTLAEAYSGLQPAVARLLTDHDVFRVLPVSDNAFEPGDIRELREMLRPTFSDQEIYDYIVASKWKETLQPNLPLRYHIASLDGYDGGMLPLQSFLDLKKLFPLREKQSPDGRLREELDAVPDPKLLAMLNVKYLLLDRVRDAWLDGVYYDLAIDQGLDATNRELVLNNPSSFETTSIGIISHLSGATKLKDNEVIAEVIVADAQGKEQSFPLRVGKDTSEGKFSEAAASGQIAHDQARKAKAWNDDPNAWDYLGKITFPSPLFPKSIRIRYVGGDGSLTLRGISLIDDRTHTDVPVALSPSLEIVHLGDVKVYRNKEVWPRAFVVQQDQKPAITNGAQNPPIWAAIQIDRADVQGGQGITGSVVPDAASIVNYEPERVEVKTNSTAKGFLVLTDSYYPGWRVTVDGTDAPMLLANKFFKAVELGPGEHDVQFVYEPQMLRIGIFISVISAIAIVALIAVGTRSRIT